MLSIITSGSYRTLGKMVALRLVLGGKVLVALCSFSIVHAQAPALLNYQGRVQVGTNDFNGAGQFKFAFVGADGANSYWSNDGTTTGQPSTAVTLPVTRGLYSVLLGNTAVPNMITLPPGVFTNDDVYLRVWFNDGVNGFQQFVPDQRIINPPYAATAGSLTGAISVDQLPPGIPRATNGITTIAGDTVVQGTLTAADIAETGMALSSGLPSGSTVTVLINNVIAPGVRFEGLTREEIILSRVTTDLSWPGVFAVITTTGSVTNFPVAVRLSLPNGGEISWSLPGSTRIGDSTEGLPSYDPVFSRPIGRDGKPYDRVRLRPLGAEIKRSETNLIATGSIPILVHARPWSGQPSASALRLIVDGVNYNNIALEGEIEPTLGAPLSVIINSSFHRDLCQWALPPTNPRRSVEIVLVNGLPGTTVSLANVTYTGIKGAIGVTATGYEVRVAADGLPYEVITIERN